MDNYCSDNRSGPNRSFTPKEDDLYWRTYNGAVHLDYLSVSYFIFQHQGARFANPYAEIKWDAYCDALADKYPDLTPNNKGRGEPPTKDRIP